jgi:hypothetical protein
MPVGAAVGKAGPVSPKRAHTLASPSRTANSFANVDTPGNITWTGQTVVLVTNAVVSPGAITWAGSSVVLVITAVVAPGAITWTGSTVSTVISTLATPGAITWTGQTVTAGVQTVVVVTVPGAITWTGQTVVLVVAPAPDVESLWVRENRYHQNYGHWDDVSQGRVLRWPP